MDFAHLSSSPVLSTLRCSDPERAIKMLPGARRRLLPLAGDCKFFQANLQLGRLRLVIVNRPPCASEGYLDPRQVGIALSMDESAGLKLDGVSLDQPVLCTHGLTTPHRIFQPGELTIAGLFLPSEDCERGWPERVPTMRIDRIQHTTLQQLRSTIRDVFRLSSRDPQRFLQRSVVAGMQESLLGAIDHAFATAPGEKASGLAEAKYARICRVADEFIRGAKGMPSGADVAAAAGVTVRTLHNAMIAVNGMSLQRFMILSRLWAVRAALLRAGPQGLIKTIAFDHGFWHLGRFSRTYRAFFGESPSDTLSHARRAIG